MTGEPVDDRTDPEDAPTVEGGSEYVEAESTTEERSYGGLFGSYPYAFRQSDSLLFKSYAVVGGLLALLIALLFTFGLIGVIASTTGTGGGVFSFSRAFFLFVGLLVVFPLLAPVLSVARRHRRVGSNARSDATLAACGYLFLITLYLALLASIPPELQSPPVPPTISLVIVDFQIHFQVPSLVWAPIALLVNTLYALPAIAGLVPPVVGAAAIYAAHRLTR